MDWKANYFVTVALYPFHIVVIDHVLLDIDLVDDNTGVVLGRPWLTLGIDIFSRMIWCMYISFTPPSSITLLRAIEDGVFPKDAKGCSGTNDDWDVFGVPEILLVDGGKEFRSDAVVRAVEKALHSTP